MSLCTHNVHYFCLHAVVQVGNVHPGCRKSWDSEVGCGTGPCQLGCTDSNEAYGMMPWGFGFSSTRVGVSDHQTPTEQQVSLEETFVLFFLADRASNGKRWEMAWASFCGSGKLSRFPSLISVKDWDWRLTCGQWDPDIFLLIIIMCSHPVLFPLPVPSGQPSHQPFGIFEIELHCLVQPDGYSCWVAIDDVTILFTKLSPLSIEAGTSMENTAAPLSDTYPDLFCTISGEKDKGKTDKCPWALSQFVVKS